MIKSKYLFNKDSINIFTDASIYQLSSGGTITDMIACPGYVVENDGKILDMGFNILHNSTNNIGELSAILMGVNEAKKYQNFKYVRLFSDSQTSLFAVRNRIFNWVRNTKPSANILYGYDGAEIKNLSYILDIIYTILSNNIKVEFYHQKGHVVVSNVHSLNKAMQVFKDSNGIRSDIDFNLIEIISNLNNVVDEYTRNALHDNLSLNDKLISPISFIYRNELFDQNKYKQLIYKGENNNG